eukprot:5097433-Pleurochrysis_carterae.AAC.4
MLQSCTRSVTAQTPCMSFACIHVAMRARTACTQAQFELAHSVDDCARTDAHSQEQVLSCVDLHFSRRAHRCSQAHACVSEQGRTHVHMSGRKHTLTPVCQTTESCTCARPSPT